MPGQAAALSTYLEQSSQDFLAVATPGAGKTTYALRLATELLGRGTVTAVTIVAPTEHLKTQWADAAARVGIHIDPRFSNSSARHSHEYDGVALTYAQVASKPSLHRTRTQSERTLVILDEIHHGGDNLSWGDAIREAFVPAVRRLALTGTRSGPTPRRSRSCATRPTATASAAPQRTTPTGMPRLCGTASCGPCCSWRTAARCAGAPRPATRSPRASGSR